MERIFLDKISKEFTVDAKERTVKMFVLIHALLADGLFAGKQSMRLVEARAFVETIHAQALKDLEADPVYIERLKKEKEDGRPVAGDQTPKGSTPQESAS